MKEDIEKLLDEFIAAVGRASVSALAVDLALDKARQLEKALRKDVPPPEKKKYEGRTYILRNGGNIYIKEITDKLSGGRLEVALTRKFDNASLRSLLFQSNICLEFVDVIRRWLDCEDTEISMREYNALLNDAKQALAKYNAGPGKE